MTLVFIHGIAQDPDPGHAGAITESWRGALAKHDGDGRIDAQPRLLCYYGDILHRYSRQRRLPHWADPVSLMTGADGGLMLDLLIEIVQSVDFRLLGLPAPPPSMLVIADTRDFLGPISAYLSLLPADLIALLRRFLLEADIYFTTPAAAAEIDTRVLHTLGPALAAGDRPVVVGHSLGSVIAWKLLAQWEAAGRAGQVRQFVTMGSPLALRTIRKRAPQPFRRPAFVAEWRNYYAATDLVAGGQGLPLDGLTYTHNHRRRGMPFPYHLAEDYLDHAPLAENLAAVLA
ncbi:hypothetical protein [Sphingopyxis panaciterrulae]|uniref:Pimeloyl-ACP methyl ester carboxylesterase n=1 Tax=Sphingopyxis panaciterrulae TaxID=462372 RepID=A0A7W9B8G7_9SPHN|nr:hypothetical protein [Sphingopyxis panaciterrulae]MBB5707809.1 pimeloyl-ACP methyl ester carboxylesterase [Sphingopyxis panaciterrulae]